MRLEQLVVGVRLNVDNAFVFCRLGCKNRPESFRAPEFRRDFLYLRSYQVFSKMRQQKYYIESGQMVGSKRDESSSKNKNQLTIPMHKTV